MYLKQAFPCLLKMQQLDIKNLAYFINFCLLNSENHNNPFPLNWASASLSALPYPASPTTLFDNF